MSEKENPVINLVQVTGTGIADDPILISSVEEFDNIRNNLAGCYRLMEDIDFKGKSLIPIGTVAKPFTGQFDGSGHTIRNFKISVSTGQAGLFGYASSAELKNLNVKNAEITSTVNASYAGGFAGILLNCITKNISVSDVTVTGIEYVGGMAGSVSNGSVSECCASGIIVGRSKVGGLAGHLEGTIRDSFALGSVTSVTTVTTVGGLIGNSLKATIANCYAACRVSRNGRGLVFQYMTIHVADSYFDCSKATECIVDDKNIGKMTPTLTRKAFFSNWDFENVWNMTDTQTYPYLRRTGRPSGVEADGKAVYEGLGTREEPYLIKAADALFNIPYEPTGCYRLMADLDLNGEEIMPIGTRARPFQGVFEGCGHVIKNFKITSAADDTGLFGYCKSAELRELRLENATVRQTSKGIYTGALAGYLEGCDTQSILLSDIKVTGADFTGGISGYISGGKLINCCVCRDSAVSGTAQVGGLAGMMTGISTVKVTECCVNATITGRTYVGGLIGKVGVAVSNCYATGSVTSTLQSELTGGLVVTGSSVKIMSCYSACRVSNRGSGLVYGSAVVTYSYFDSTLAGITTSAAGAKTTEQLMEKGTFAAWDLNNTWVYQEGAYPKLKGVEAIKQKPFEISLREPEESSVLLSWPEIPGAQGYDIFCGNRLVSSTATEILMERLAPDTEYSCQVRADLNKNVRIWSALKNFRTQKPELLTGLHCTAKGSDSVTLIWNPLKENTRYEVHYNGKVLETTLNTCVLTGLAVDVPYIIRVRAFAENSNALTSSPITVKLYSLSPKTDYAKTFIEKCEGQTWFLDEVENLLNLKGKSINTIASQRDFSAIYAIGLGKRGLSGKIPAAVGELIWLKYLYLGGNHLEGMLPAELENLKQIVEMDLSGNSFQV